ncbi:MAG: alpha-mannosidase [Caldilineaceae bacterium]|nr:alpha-mannosidase [Caldilineaceae bacterium]
MYHKNFWTVEKIGRRIQLLTDSQVVYRRTVTLPAFRYLELPATGFEPAPPLIGAEVDRSQWTVIEPNNYWGQRYTNFMLSTTFTVPADWPADGVVSLYLPLGESGDFSHPETLAYIDGVAYAAGDRHHQEIRLPARWRDGAEHLLDLHGWSGLFGDAVDPSASALFMRACKVVLIDQPTRDFLITARVALETSTRLDDNDPAKGHLLNALDAAFKVLDTRSPAVQSLEGLSFVPGSHVAFGDDFYASVPAAHAALQEGIAKAGPPLNVTVIGSGHAHIDVAWLWTLGITRQKAGRTFSTVMRLMEQFPEYHFTQSQPQLYDYVRRDYPELFEEIKARIADQRWEPIGGMWVEADCNLSGPESLARQFLLGRSFYREHFGADAESPILWLPDVFGYAWNLPQLIKEAGLEYFFTIKIGWSQYNRLPYDSFWWQGLDGTKVLTHFSTTPDFGAFASTYNAMATPAQNLGTWTNFQQKEMQHTLLMAFGYGDGGGGPTREMLENIREMNNFPGLPKMRNGSAKEFYRTLEAEAGAQLPTWNGELYLELHRGTYTTQSRNKRANRKSEFLLHDAEFLATLAHLGGDYIYPQTVLNKAWELVCLNQFHDIIPGSSIAPVYVESQAQYAEIRQMAEGVIEDAITALTPAGVYAMIVNPTSFGRSDLAFLAEETSGEEKEMDGAVPALAANGRAVVVQATAGGLLIDAGETPPFSVTPLVAAKNAAAAPTPGALEVASDRLENAFVRVELDSAGDITRIYDKVNSREVLPAGAVANQFQAHEDRPNNWDAWDVDIFLSDKRWLAEPATSIEVSEAGPLRATLTITRRILSSVYTQRISLCHNRAQVDITTDIDWRERATFLKVAFPVDVLSPKATYEIQWGNTERPTHWNTSWDWARFETCAQKWVDLSEGGYGVSVLNDCKYGHDIKDNVIRISLLRGPGSPDPTADLGMHTFSYSILPHAGGWNEGTVQAAYALNDPLLVRRGEGRGARGDAKALITCDAANVIVETVKRAEDGDGVIVRLYETQRRRGTIILTTGFPLQAAARTNLLEEEKQALVIDGNTVRYDIRPYEIVTLRLVPA